MVNRKTVMVRIYREDREILKQMSSKSIATAVVTLIHGNKEDMKELVAQYMDSHNMASIKDKEDKPNLTIQEMYEELEPYMINDVNTLKFTRSDEFETSCKQLKEAYLEADKEKQGKIVVKLAKYEKEEYKNTLLK